MHDISYRSQLASVYETDRQLYYLLAHCCASGMYHYHAHTHRAHPPSLPPSLVRLRQQQLFLLPGANIYAAVSPGPGAGNGLVVL